MFCDESMFYLDEEGEIYWITPGEGKPVRYDTPTRIRIMVWGAISYTGRSTLHIVTHSLNSTRYTQLLSRYFLSFYRQHRHHTMLHDNATCHVSHYTGQWLGQQNVNVYSPYPARSPEFNAIEKVWSWMHNYVRHRRPSTQQRLHTLIRQAWREIPQTTIQAYIRHSQTVVQLVIDAQGGNIVE